MENCEEGIEVGGQVVGDVRLADDQGMVSSSQDGLQRLIDRLNETANRFNMKINVQKTKTMVVSKDEGPAKESFSKKKEVLTKGGLSRTLKKRMVKVLMWPVVLYGCETWTLRKEEINRLEAWKYGCGECWKRLNGRIR